MSTTNIYSTEDTALQYVSPASTYYCDQNAVVVQDFGDDWVLALFRFGNLRDYAACVINSISFHYNAFASTVSGEIEARRITSGWVECTVNYNTRPSTTTSNRTYKTVSGSGWYEHTVTDLVKDIINQINLGNDDNGVCLYDYNAYSGIRYVYIGAREGSNDPHLYINYSPRTVDEACQNTGYLLTGNMYHGYGNIYLDEWGIGGTEVLCHMVYPWGGSVDDAFEEGDTIIYSNGTSRWKVTCTDLFYGQETDHATFRECYYTDPDNIYVDIATGDDDNHGGNWSYPFKTAKKGIDNLPSNNDVHIAFGNYGSQAAILLNQNINLIGENNGGGGTGTVTLPLTT